MEILHLLETVLFRCGRLVEIPLLVHFYTMFSASDLYALVEERRKELGLSQADVCMRAFGKPDNTAIQSLKKGSVPSVDRMAQLASALDLEIYIGKPRETGPVEQIVLDGAEFAQVPVHEVCLAAGGGADNHTEELVGHLAFRRSWLKRVGVAASAAVLARATGESMAPTIHDGDMLLIDRSKAEPPAARRSAKDTRPSPIYALRDHDTGARVKRLELAAPGTLALLSDNPSFAPEFRPADSVKIIGKVVWWGHTSKE